MVIPVRIWDYRKLMKGGATKNIYRKKENTDQPPSKDQCLKK